MGVVVWVELVWMGFELVWGVVGEVLLYVDSVLGWMWGGVDLGVVDVGAVSARVEARRGVVRLVWVGLGVWVEAVWLVSSSLKRVSRSAWRFLKDVLSVALRVPRRRRCSWVGFSVLASAMATFSVSRMSSKCARWAQR